MNTLPPGLNEDEILKAMRASLAKEMQLSTLNELVQAHPEKPQVSDGYHTFNELYDHRVALYVAMVYLCKAAGYRTWRSKLHADETGYEGWYVLGVELPQALSSTTRQVTYHLPDSTWQMTGEIETLEKGEYDGHTSADVLERLAQFTTQLAQEAAARRLLWDHNPVFFNPPTEHY